MTIDIVPTMHACLRAGIVYPTTTLAIQKSLQITTTVQNKEHKEHNFAASIPPQVKGFQKWESHLPTQEIDNKV